MKYHGGALNIRAASMSDINDIVNIHLKAFEGFFLSMLGPLFLRCLYKAFINGESGILRVAELDGIIVGFAAGTSEPQTFFYQLRKTKGLAFVFRAIPGMLRHPIVVVKKLFHAAFYKGDSPVRLTNVALLSSIAVLPRLTAKSIGKALLADFEVQAKQSLSTAVYLTTDKCENENVLAFYTRAGYQVESGFRQSTGREMLRFIKYI